MPSRSDAPRRATRRDTEAGRWYEIDGQRYPSVTWILSCLAKPALIAWAAREERTLVMEAAADLYRDLTKLPTPLSRPAFLATLGGRIGQTKAHVRASQTALDIGSQVHQAIEWQLRRDLGQAVGRAPALSDEAQWALMAWDDWRRSVDLRPLYVEQVVFSAAHGYAGTMDLLALVDGRRILIDLKTSKAIYGEAHLQNVAYQQALADMGHEPAEAGLIVRVPKTLQDPAFEVQEVSTRELLFPIFAALRVVWAWWHAQQAGRAKPTQETTVDVPLA